MPQQSRPSRRLSTAALALMVGLVPAVSYAAIHQARDEPALASAPVGETARGDLDQALRSVVTIGPAETASGALPGPPSGNGSGFVFDGLGHVITNAHVVGAARTVSVGLIDGRRFDAAVVGVDARTDLAVVRLPPQVAVMPLAMAVEAEGARGVGSPVFALGNPMGFSFSVTSGVISGAGRRYDVLTPIAFLQHDAALNPGSSGGPLVDPSGRVLGVNTATPPETIFDIGIGLAIPADVAADVARRLIAEGSIARGALGVRVSHADAAVAEALGAPGAPGALVDNVEPEGAAARAGIRAGDLILTIDRISVAYPRDVLSLTMSLSPGHRATLEFVRGGQRRSAVVTLQRDAPEAPAATARGGGIARVEDPDLGLRLDPAAAGEGATIADVAFGSLAQLYGLGAGDRIEAMNGSVVADAADFRRRLELAVGAVIVLRVQRPGLGVRHINVPRTRADSASRHPGMASEQQSALL